MAMRYYSIGDSNFPQRSSLLALASRLEATCWFSKVGRGYIPNTQRLASWGDVSMTLRSNADWENMLLDAGNEASLRAFLTDPHKFQESWNPLSTAVMELVDPILNTRLKCAITEVAMGADLFEYYRGFIRSAFLYISYFEDDRYESIEVELLKLSLDGYCPCGYSGKHPNGITIVY